MGLRTIPKNKKGMGIGDLYPVILTIALVAILIAVVMMIFSNFMDAVSDNNVTITNETLTALNITTPPYGAYVNNQTECGFNNMVVTRVANATGGEEWTVTTDYVANASNGLIVGKHVDINNSILVIDYSYDWGKESCEALEDVTDDFTDFIPWIGVILLVVAAAIVLGILIRNLSSPGSSRV